MSSSSRTYQTTHVTGKPTPATTAVGNPVPRRRDPSPVSHIRAISATTVTTSTTIAATSIKPVWLRRSGAATVPKAAEPRRRYPREMRPLRYSINVTLDGCCDHRAVDGGPELHRHAAANLERADALVFGRVTYQMMEDGFRSSDPLALRQDPFAERINAVKKYVVSSTLESVDWNSELLQGDPVDAVRQLKQEPGEGLALGGVRLPLALAEAGLIDEYELVVHPRIVGHGPSLFAGLSSYVDLRLVDRIELDSGAVALRYEPQTVR